MLANFSYECSIFAELPIVVLGNPVFRETQCESHSCVLIELFAVLLNAQLNLEQGCQTEIVSGPEQACQTEIVSGPEQGCQTNSERARAGVSN